MAEEYRIMQSEQKWRDEANQKYLQGQQIGQQIYLETDKPIVSVEKKVDTSQSKEAPKQVKEEKRECVDNKSNIGLCACIARDDSCSKTM